MNAIPKLEGSPFAFPAHRSDGYYERTPKLWRIIRDVAGFEDVRMHDLRHSFASMAVSGGAGLPIIGALLGHKDSATTQLYTHLDDDPLGAAAEAVGDKLSAILKNKTCSY
ncbi:MAG: tyrosine-type recombinase/integrase [Hoeflea sp.]|nr:tyrosine-type recombinase/integrase [Hoeflea sp.]